MSTTPQDTFSTLINGFIENIKKVFENYNDEETKKNFAAPTEHLFANIAKLGLKEIKEGTYDAGQIDNNFHMYVQINKTSFRVEIEETTVNIEKEKMNYFAFSRDENRKMYMYGVKANGEGPKISGNILNKAAFDICEAMHIPELFISDSAGVPCHLDETIELQHFSILRVMAGKKHGQSVYIEGPGDTFYESLTGHFLEPDAANKEKQSIYESITDEERTLIREYLDSLKQPKDPSKSDVCTKIKEIIQKIIDSLNQNPELFNYVATPYVASASSSSSSPSSSPITPSSAPSSSPSSSSSSSSSSPPPSSAPITPSDSYVFVQISPNKDIEILSTQPTTLESGSLTDVIKNVGTDPVFIAIKITKTQNCSNPDNCIVFNSSNYEMGLDALINNVSGLTPMDDAFLLSAPAATSSANPSASTGPSTSNDPSSSTGPSASTNPSSSTSSSTDPSASSTNPSTSSSTDPSTSSSTDATPSSTDATPSSTDATPSSTDATPSSTDATPSSTNETYMEGQVYQLCGKHALNHLLQEEKIVWHPKQKTLITQGAPENSSIKDKDTKYNLWNFCQEREKNEINGLLEDYINGEVSRRVDLLTKPEPTANDAYYTESIDGSKPRGTSNLAADIEEWKKIQTKYKGIEPDKIKEDVEAEVGKDENLKKKYTEEIKRSQGTCETKGNVPFQWFAEVFDNLGYRFIEVGKKDYQAELEQNLNSPTYLGFFINQGTWHYVSSPKYSNYENNCEYVIADSMGPNNKAKYTCYKSKDEYYDALKVLPVERGYLIFAEPDSYQSVAVERMNKSGAKVKLEAEVKSSVKSDDDKSTDVNLTDDKSTDVNLTDDKSTDVNLTDDKSTDDKSTDDKSTDDKSTDDKSTDDKSTDDKSTDDKSDVNDVKVADVNKKFIRPPPPGPPPRNLQAAKNSVDEYNAKSTELTTVFNAKKFNSPKTYKNEGGSLKNQRKKNKKTKRKYYVYNKK